MKLTTDVILLFLPSVNDDVFVYFDEVELWTMKLTESMDTCTNDRVACIIKVNIKETFMENEAFLQMFRW